jgi:uncharacterized membrane protein YfcA
MNLAGLSLTTTIIAISAMAVGSAFQAALGMGLALLVVPVLALADPDFIPGPMLLAGSILSAMTAYRDRRAIDAGALGASLAGLAAGTLAGAMALHLVAGPNVQRVFGWVILFAVIVSACGKPVAANARNLLIGGTAAGVMGTMVGIHGPPIVLMFQNAEPKVARAMLGAFFTVAYLGTVAALSFVGLFGTPEIVRSIILLPGVAAGLALAPLTQRLVNRDRLRLAILGVAVVGGILLIRK